MNTQMQKVIKGDTQLLTVHPLGLPHLDKVCNPNKDIHI